MSYQALYRVWRPQSFDELVGQNVITETLKNAVANQQISHAYLFTGPRGTGKTSAAKIFAKAINCPNQVDGNPCNHCQMCQAITQGQLSDVVEIDAASNNGVDEIRNLRDNVRYAASQARYKVYIIDEVHMLTTGAFNALLKTLEEPPEGVIFILATTEPHKIPATIISRTQRFDFKRISQASLVKQMEKILQSDQIDYQDEALQVIARAANGGMRDSLSLLDQVLSYQPNQVDLTSALEVSGSLDQLAFVDYLLALYHHQTDQALQVLKEQLQAGKQANRFIEELILFARDVLLTNYAEVNQTLLSLEELEPLRQEIPESFYYYLIDQLNEVQNKMRFASQSDLYVEVMTIQLAQVEHGQENSQAGTASSAQVNALVENLTQELARVKAQVQQLATQIEKQDVRLANEVQLLEDETRDQESEKPIQRQPRKRPQFSQAVYQCRPQEIYHILNIATHQDIGRVKQGWEGIINHLSPQDRVKFTGVQPIAAGPKWLLLSFSSATMAGTVQNNTDLLQAIYQSSKRELDQGYYPLIIAEKDWRQVRSDYTVLRKSNQGQAIELADEVYQELQALKQKIDQDEPTDREDKFIHQATSVSESEADALAEDDQDQGDHPGEDAPDEVPEVVSKAIDLFGEDKVNIFYQ
ncbi:DNA polymerase III subunit gamma/tau [Ignavigranum ruoffiae]|uniref:DNA polymerase III subunit gamma/tau n=1 Tax=Ignavigranum ruoffiae TaxID=89093 RepID=UPI0024ACEE3A|nr:DNA polymerase III subunit gamma/tau [Ignavigranum ruoffiae]